MNGYLQGGWEGPVTGRSPPVRAGKLHAGLERLGLCKRRETSSPHAQLLPLHLWLSLNTPTCVVGGA